MDHIKLKELNKIAKQLDKWIEYEQTIVAIEQENEFREELTVYELIDILKSVDLIEETKLRIRRQANQLKATFAKL